MSNKQGITIDPRTGKVYRLTAPKGRPPEYTALLAAVVAAKEAQGSYMRDNQLAWDATNNVTKQCQKDGVWVEYASAEDMKLQELLVATRAAQLAVRQYKKDHPSEFQASVKKAGIPVIRPGRPNGR
jgi:hypothetical protein